MSAGVITCNGRREEIPSESIVITELLALKGINAQTVVVEINLDIIERALFSTRAIRSGDTVEIVRFVGGG